MGLDEIKKMLDTTGYPVAYYAFKKRQEPPFICYLEAETNNFFADNEVYQKITQIQVELYTAYKDRIAEARVENALSSFCWDKTETFIETENVYQITYEFEV